MGAAFCMESKSGLVRRNSEKKGRNTMIREWKAIVMAGKNDGSVVEGKPICLSQLLGMPVIQYVLDALKEAGAKEICVLSSEEPEEYEKVLERQEGIWYLKGEKGSTPAKDAGFFDSLEEDVVMVSANTPLLQAEEIKELVCVHQEHGNAATYYMPEAGARTPVMSHEHGFCFCFRANYLADALDAVSKYAATNILTRVVADGGRAEQRIKPDCGAFDIIRNRVQMAAVLKKLQIRINEMHMMEGVMIMSPEMTYITPHTVIGKNTLIYPGTYLEGHTVIGENCVIGPNSRLISAQVKDGAEITYSTVLESEIGAGTHVGPYAYVRPGSRIGDDAKIGDFVEIKNSNIGNGTKISHLTYVGDADVGERVNFGCGTVVVNYDGVHKHRTVIENDAFIGCNTNLVSPVHVAEGAFTAAGSTITEDVPAKNLAIARARQVNKGNWVSPKQKEQEQ